MACVHSLLPKLQASNHRVTYPHIILNLKGRIKKIDVTKLHRFPPPWRCAYCSTTSINVTALRILILAVLIRFSLALEII